MRFTMGILLSGFALASIPADNLLRVETLENMSATEIGAMVLADQDHSPIFSVERVSGLHDPQGQVELRLIEAAEDQGEYCSRRVWSARFLYDPATSKGALDVRSVVPVRQIALKRLEPCNLSSYFSLSYMTSEADALRALQRFEAIVHEMRKAPWCDDTSDRVCRKRWENARDVLNGADWTITVNSTEAQVKNPTCTRVSFDFEQQGYEVDCPPPPMI